MPTQQTLFNYFTQYNLRVWPMQTVGYVLCLIVLSAAVKKFKYSDQTIAAILAFLWTWLGIMFWPPADGVMPMVQVLVALWLIQGALFLVSIVRPLVSYRVGTDAYSLTGLALIMFAAIVYPLIGYAVGHVYPQSLTLGAFPCPTTIFTLGLFLCTANKVPKYLVVVPALGAIILGSSALMGIVTGTSWIYEDIGLLISGIVGPAVLVYRDRPIMPKTALRPAG